MSAIVDTRVSVRADQRLLVERITDRGCYPVVVYTKRPCWTCVDFLNILRQRREIWSNSKLWPGGESRYRIRNGRHHHPSYRLYGREHWRNTSGENQNGALFGHRAQVRYPPPSRPLISFLPEQRRILDSYVQENIGIDHSGSLKWPDALIG